MKSIALYLLMIPMMFFIIIMLSNLKLKLEYKRHDENDNIYLEAGLWFGLITFKYNIPLVQLQSLINGVKVEQKIAPSDADAPKVHRGRFAITRRKVIRTLQTLLRFHITFFDLMLVAKRILKHVKCEKLEWYTRIGVGDAPATAVITGMVWGVKSMIIGFISNLLILRTIPRLNVVPEYQGSSIDTHFICIVRLRIGHAIIAGTRILYKSRKGREGLWQTTLFRA